MAWDTRSEAFKSENDLCFTWIKQQSQTCQSLFGCIKPCSYSFSCIASQLAIQHRYFVSALKELPIQRVTQQSEQNCLCKEKQLNREDECNTNNALFRITLYSQHCLDVYYSTFFGALSIVWMFISLHFLVHIL